MKSNFLAIVALGASAQAQDACPAGPLSQERGEALARRSSGALMLLDRGGDLVQPPAVGRRRSPRSADATLNAGLDPRVGSNLRLGDDPTQLPPAMHAQAEPHIARHPSQPDLLAATFQEGRFTDGGAVNVGYAISQDGGLTWSRGLLPLLTQLDGGAYQRATDPVAGVDLQGNIYINTLGIADADKTLFALAISRSTNGGLSFEPPTEIYSSPDWTLQPDKNWLAINTFAQTPTVGRIVVTWTQFTLDPYPIACSFSDDQGRTWSPVSYATPGYYYCQGSQPVFLPDGTLAVIYWNFASNLTGGESIEIVTSPDGGATFSPPRLVTPAVEYSPPGIRSGAFLPSATVDRTNGTLFVTYQGWHQGAPRILFTKSSDQGVSWTAPQEVSDNPANGSVFNPAITVSPDGQVVTIAFYDQRVNPDDANWVDLFLARSFDGGATWQPNLRLTTTSSDVRLAPLTASGYMLGDYLGVAPPILPDVPAVPVWVDTRTGSPDPFIARVGMAPEVTFGSWRAARFSTSQISNPAIGGTGADPDTDGQANLLEYAFGLNPCIADQPVFPRAFSGSGAAVAFSAVFERVAGAADLSYAWTRSADLRHWSTATPGNVVVIPDPVRHTETVESNFEPVPDASQFYRLGVTLSR